MFSGLQLLGALIFLQGATSLFSFLQTYETSKSKGYLPLELFYDPVTLHITQGFPFEAFYNKYNKLLDKEVSWQRWFRFSKLLQRKHDQHKVTTQIEIQSVGFIWLKKCQYLLSMWEHEKMCFFEDCFRWYKDKDVVPR